MRDRYTVRWHSADSGTVVPRRARQIMAAMITMLMLTSMGHLAAGQESDSSDPRVNVTFPELTIDCSGTASFTSVVSVDYYRSETSAIVDIFEGDPDNGGTLRLVLDASLPEGTATWSLPLDPYYADPGFWIQIRWIVTAWSGDSGLDYVGEWRGTANAPGEDCADVDLIQRLVLVLKQVLERLLRDS